MPAGWDPTSSGQPLPPKNGTVYAPYLKGTLDIRWDDPRQLAGNSRYTVVGVNLYRSDVSDRGPYYRINEFPLGGTFYRDQTSLVSIRETVLWDQDWIFRGDAPNDYRWVLKTKNPIYQTHYVDLQEPIYASNTRDVTLMIDNEVVPVQEVFGPSGEVTLYRTDRFDVVIEKTDHPILPTPTSVVEIVYHTLRNQVSLGMSSNLFYRLSTVVLDPTSPSGYFETDLNYCAPFQTTEVEPLDYIWREGVRRNNWILQQGGERVKVFIRRVIGIPCTCYMDPRLREFTKQPSQRCLTCFPPGTEVTMADLSRKAIDLIQVGDEVLTHKGRLRRVTEIMSRDVHENLVQLDATHGVGFSSTSNHPILIVRKEDARCLRLKSLTCTGSGSKSICIKNNCNREVCPQWVRADEIRTGDYLAFPIPLEHPTEELSSDVLRFLGYYAAEGWTSAKYKKGIKSSNDKRVMFGFHQDELLTHVEEIRQIVDREFGGTIWVGPAGDSKGIEVLVTVVRAVEMVLKHVGKYSTLKHLSRQLVEQGAEGLAQFLGAYFNGDGWQCLNPSSTKFGVSSASYQMARQVEGLLIKLGAVPRLTSRTRTINNPDRPGAHSTTAHSVEIRKNDMHILARFMKGEPVVPNKKGGWSFRTGSLVLYPVHKIVSMPYQGPVFNFEVEEDHSYVAGGAVAHNCFGTGFVGGYEGPFDIIIAPPDAEQKIAQTPIGRRQDWTYEVWTGPSPVLTQRDFIVKQTNERYSIGPVRRPTNRGNLLQQHFSIFSMTESDIRYEVPIYGVDALTFPQTRYEKRSVQPPPAVGGELQGPTWMADPNEVPHEIGAVPVVPLVTEKEGWSDELEQRGRTATWENHNEGK